MGSWGTRQHRVPAAIIGRHGEPAGEQLRDALVRAIRLDSGRVYGPVAARSVFFETGAYDYSEHGRTADHLWTATENQLPAAANDLQEIGRLHLHGRQTSTASDDNRLLQAGRVVASYAAEIAHRHPGFDAVLASHGWEIDQIQAFREQSVEARRKAWDPLRRNLWVLVAEDEGQEVGLLLNNWGWVQIEGAVEGLLLPLGWHLGVIFSLEDRPDAGIEIAPLTGSSLDQARTAMIEARTESGVPPPHTVVGHPTDKLFKQGPGSNPRSK